MIKWNTSQHYLDDLIYLLLPMIDNVHICKGICHTHPKKINKVKYKSPLIGRAYPFIIVYDRHILYNPKRRAVVNASDLKPVLYN